MNRLIAIGDIHGCYISLQKLIDQLNPSSKDTLIFLGDYIDRGLQSKNVIDLILNLVKINIPIVTLMGNHEYFLLNAISQQNSDTWMLNGGYNTLKSFGIHSADELSQEYLSFFSTLKYYYAVNDYLFVHAGFNDKSANPFKDYDTMIWTRQHHYTNPTFKNKTIIHGHTPITLNQCQKAIHGHAQDINLDTGCVYKTSKGKGFLTALVINTNEIISIQNLD